MEEKLSKISYCQCQKKEEEKKNIFAANWASKRNL
jgi:hypothetical protein